MPLLETAGETGSFILGNTFAPAAGAERGWPEPRGVGGSFVLIGEGMDLGLFIFSASLESWVAVSFACSAPSVFSFSFSFSVLFGVSSSFSISLPFTSFSGHSQVMSDLAVDGALSI